MADTNPLILTECPDSPTGRHVPDADTVSLLRDGDHVFVDVSCKHCGRSGCLAHAVLGEWIDW